MSPHADHLQFTGRGRLGSFTLDAQFAVPARGITAIFGASGCGKTTVLRCLAGLQRLSGHVRLRDETWQDSDRGVFVPPHARHLGYVFQEASLFPHLSVRDNLLFGARRVKMPTQDALAFDDIVELLNIQHLLERSTARLSGGERQRIAVGRALLAQPRLLLMDEPLSALDRISKDEILPYFELLHERLALPIVYISHDFSEVERLADTLVLMEAGRVLAHGPLRELQLDPTLPLLTAPGASAVLEGVITAYDARYHLSTVTVPGGQLLVPGQSAAIGERRRLRVAASDVSLAKSDPGRSTIINTLGVVVRAIHVEENSAYAHVVAAIGGSDAEVKLAARITRKSLAALEIAVGDAMIAQIKSVALAAARPGRGAGAPS
jgi:molybdate transport system ATP-binding protein